MCVDRRFPLAWLCRQIPCHFIIMQNYGGQRIRNCLNQKGKHLFLFLFLFVNVFVCVCELLLSVAKVVGRLIPDQNVLHLIPRFPTRFGSTRANTIQIINDPVYNVGHLFSASVYGELRRAVDASLCGCRLEGDTR